MKTVNQRGFISAVLASGLLLACASDPPKQNDVLNLALGKTDVLPQWSSSFSAGKFDELTLGFPIDAQLRKLIQEGITNNLDVRMARTRVDQARGVLTATSGKSLPTVGLGGQLGTSTIPTATSGISGGGLIATWELDLWGRIASASSAAEARANATDLDRFYAQQAVAAGVIKSWIAITEAQQQDALSQKLLDYAKKQNQITKQGERVGRNTAQDVSLSATTVDVYQNQMITYQTQLNQAKRSMEILLGRYPAAEIHATDTFPSPITEIPAGIPSEILTRRPDVLAAQQRYNAAFYDTAEAKRARLPSLKLNAGVAYIGDSAILLSSGINNPVTSLTGQLFAPIFMGGQLEANQNIKTAKQEEVLAQYAKTSLNALSEVEYTLDNDNKLKDRQTAVQSQMNHLGQVVGFEQKKYQVGKSDQYQLLQQEISLVNTQSNFIKISSERLMNRVSLHQALGGHFIQEIH
jgi:NodT family efflux transporter outer membrane factor (OMF) lipoprotein